MRGHQAISHGDEEKFIVAAEDGVPSTGGGDLRFGSRWKRHNVDFRPAGFVREVREPTWLEEKRRSYSLTVIWEVVGGRKGLRSPVNGKIKTRRVSALYFLFIRVRCKQGCGRDRITILTVRRLT